MELSDIVPDGKPIRLYASTRDGAIRELLLELVKNGALAKAHVEVSLKKLLDRETFGSTGIGGGVAVPHARLPGECEVMTAFGISSKGIPWKAQDGAPVYAVFLMLSGETPNGRSLEALAAISRLVRDDHFLDGFRDEFDPDMT